MWIPALLGVATAILYLPRLHKAPLYVSHDEAVYALQAHALASTGRDLSGRFLPVYIEYPPQYGRPTWDQPMLIYAIATTLKVLPFSEFSVRLPMAIAAIVDVLLVYFVGRVLFQSEFLAIVAALLLALTPAHFMYSRLAIDFQLAVPFILGWLLCLLLYIRRDKPRVLFGAGVLLGAGMYSYVAGYLLMPLVALWTCVVLYQRRDPPRRYGWLVAGVVLPSVLCLPWMLRYPLPFRDVFAHYAVLGEPAANQPVAWGLIRGFAGSELLAALPTLYSSFWNPRFLFIDGPVRLRSTHQMGFFLLPVAGLLCVGLVTAARRRSLEDVVLLFGLLSAPLVASAGGEGQAIWRVLQMAPFGVLLATSGLQLLRGDDTTPAARTAIMAAFGIVISLSLWYHDALPHAQAFVRASTVPLAVIGIATLVGRVAIDRVATARGAVVAGGVLVATHVAYFLAPQVTFVGTVLLTAIGLVTLLASNPDRLGRPLLTVALLALVTTHFVYTYVDYGQLHRWGGIPASALVLAARLIGTALALTAVIGVARLMSGDVTNSLAGWHLAAVTSVALLCTELTYFFLDYFADYRLRFVHAAIVLVMTVAVAMLVRGVNGLRLGRGPIAIAGLFGIMAIQFTLLYSDYFTDSQVRGSADEEGNAKIPFEAVIDRTRARPVPTIYLGQIGPYGSGELYWKFYLLKHHREDLLEHTVSDRTFKPERIRTLPGGSLVVTSHTGTIDSTIDDLMTRGQLKNRELLRAPNGAPIFWILETAGG